jgi:YidC/Oxa1 family membrane protein insertase
MEKKFFHFFFVMFLFLLAWSFLFPQKPTPQVEPELSEQSEIAIDEEEKNYSSDEYIAQDLAEIETETKDFRIGDYNIKYSATGGYIKELLIEGDEEPLVYKNIGLSPDHIELPFAASLREDRIIFTAPDGQKKEFIFDGNVIKIAISPALQSRLIVFSSYTVKNPIDQRYQEVFYQYKQNNITERRYFTDRVFGLFGKGVNDDVHKGVSFAGARDRYYCASLLDGDYILNWEKIEYKTTENKREIQRLRLDLYLDEPGNEIAVYIGPQTEKDLQPFGLQWVIYYGIFHSISMLMVKVLFFFFAITKSWGLSIILFSASIYCALLPFTAKSMKAMKRMQQLQPDLEELKTKHKDNPQKLQKETMEFYKKHKINPISGCLPLFFQMPIFLAMYQVIFRLFDLKGASFLWIKDLSLPDRLYELPFTIPILNSSYINLLPILVMILGLVQQKITTSSTSGAGSQQKTMGLFMTVFIGFIFYTFPAALVLYWFVQNIFTLVYQTRLAKIRPSA